MGGLAFRVTKEDRAGMKGRPFFVCLGSEALEPIAAERRSMSEAPAKADQAEWVRRSLRRALSSRRLDAERCDLARQTKIERPQIIAQVPPTVVPARLDRVAYLRDLVRFAMLWRRHLRAHRNKWIVRRHWTAARRGSFGWDDGGVSVGAAIGG
jgi:hypothetical protein